MKERSWLHWVLAAVLVALSGLAVALAEPAGSGPSSSSHGRVTVIVGGGSQTVRSLATSARARRGRSPLARTKS